jgi:hypothetical protein
MLIASSSVMATPNNEPMPDMALLEYLAGLVEVDGELIGPMDMEKPDVKAQQQIKDKDKIEVKPVKPSTKPQEEDIDHD